MKAGFILRVHTEPLKIHFLETHATDPQNIIQDSECLTSFGESMIDCTDIFIAADYKLLQESRGLYKWLESWSVREA